MKGFKILLLGTFLILMSGIASAQPAGGGPGGPPAGGQPPCWPPPCVPVDGGIAFLIAAGVALGGKKLYDHKKETNSELDQDEKLS